MNIPAYKEIEKYLMLDQKLQKFTLEKDTFQLIVGTLGALLPVLLWLFLCVDKGTLNPLDSISHYYYTRLGGIFIIVLTLLAFFLIIYKGKDPIDFFVSFGAGISALIVLLYPTDNISSKANEICNNCAVTFLTDIPFRIKLHYISAAIFLSLLAYMSFFIFTKSDLPPEKRSNSKKKRNGIFRLCGVMIMLAISVLGLNLLFDNKWISIKTAEEINLTFWMEVIALEFFALSWFTKAGIIFKDTKEEENQMKIMRKGKEL